MFATMKDIFKRLYVHITGQPIYILSVLVLLFSAFMLIFFPSAIDSEKLYVAMFFSSFMLVVPSLVG